MLIILFPLCEDLCKLVFVETRENMYKAAAILSFCFLLSGFAFAQSSLAEFDKVRQIRLLHDNRENVRRILADYENHFSEDDEESFSDDFTTKKVEIEVTYSSGDCSNVTEFWNADKFTVTKIVISFEESIKIKDVKFDFSTFTKEVKDEDEPQDYSYQDENTGIVFKIRNNELEKIILFPAKSNASLLCRNEKTEDFFSNEQSFVELILTTPVCYLANLTANVTDLQLESLEVFADCEDAERRLNCAVWNKEISVKTIANDPENDVLTYQYTVSGGKIVGRGAKVVWDLSGLQPGNYTITAAVDDGYGFRGQTQTKTIVVK